MGKFKVKTPVRRDGADYAPGETIDLSAKEAAAMGKDVVEPAPQPASQNTNGNGGDLSKMAKVDLVIYAAQKLGLQLDQSSTKEEMLAAIATKKAE